MNRLLLAADVNFKLMTIQDSYNTLSNENRFLRERLDRLNDEIREGNINEAKISLLFDVINNRFCDVLKAKEFIYSDNTLSEYKKLILKEYFEEYVLKINTIYNVLYLYKEENNLIINNLKLPIKLTS